MFLFFFFLHFINSPAKTQAFSYYAHNICYVNYADVILVHPFAPLCDIMCGMEKLYIDPREYLRDAWRLARQVLDSGWTPDVLLALWRGGAQPGVAVHEFFKVMGLNVRHMPLKCTSYTGIAESSGAVRFWHAESLMAALKPDDRVLVVDDVFDTGRMACVYWKPKCNVTDFRPHFHVRDVDQWIVFPHEIEGLSPEEIAVKDPVLASLMRL